MSKLIPADWEVPQSFRDRLGDQVGRQRAMTSDGHLLLVLHEPPTVEDQQRTGRIFWRKPTGEWKAKRGDGIPALRKHVSEFFDRVTELEAEDHKAETATEYFQVLSALAPLRRATGNLHQALQQARELCSEDRNLINFRDQAYRVERMADLLQNDVKASLDFRIARQAEEQAQNSYQMAVSAHRLNALAAFFFPLATLSAIFGVNLKHGMEEVITLDDLTSAAIPSTPFLLVLGFGIVMGFFLRSMVNRNAPTEK